MILASVLGLATVALGAKPQNGLNINFEGPWPGQTKDCNWVMDPFTVPLDMLGLPNNYTVNPPTSPPTSPPGGSGSNSSDDSVMGVMMALAAITAIPVPTDECLMFGPPYTPMLPEPYGNFSVIYECEDSNTVIRKIYYDVLDCPKNPNVSPDEMFNLAKGNGLFLFNCDANRPCSTATVTISQSDYVPTPEPTEPPNTNSGGSNGQQISNSGGLNPQTISEQLECTGGTMGIEVLAKKKVAAGVCIELLTIWKAVEDIFGTLNITEFLPFDPVGSFNSMGFLPYNITDASEINDFFANTTFIQSYIDMFTQGVVLPFTYQELYDSGHFPDFTAINIVAVADFVNEVLSYFSTVDDLLDLVENIGNFTVPDDVQMTLEVAYELINGEFAIDCFGVGQARTLFISLKKNACAETISYNGTLLSFPIPDDSCFWYAGIWTDVECPANPGSAASLGVKFVLFFVFAIFFVR